MLFILNCHAEDNTDTEEPPEGYYAFVESPSAIPPKVRPPPYTHVNIDCKDHAARKAYVSVNNICGDLNKGQIPRNPMRQSVMGEPYPLWVNFIFFLCDNFLILLI